VQLASKIVNGVTVRAQFLLCRALITPLVLDLGKLSHLKLTTLKLKTTFNLPRARAKETEKEEAWRETRNKTFLNRSIFEFRSPVQKCLPRSEDLRRREE